MQKTPVCAMDTIEYRMYQYRFKKGFDKKLSTKNCKVVSKKYENINCPDDFNYTIVNHSNNSHPINNKCFANKYQAINAMQRISECK
jgi:hypothetical protein